MIRRWIIRWWAGRDRVQEFEFPGVLRRARRVLILMPEALDAFRQSEYFLTRLTQTFGKARITLLYPPKSLAPRFYNPHGFRIVVPGDKDVWWWGIPRRRFLNELFEKPFDVVISLNKEQSVFYAAAAVASGTPLRLGLPDGLGKPFVTVELRHGRDGADIKTEFILFSEMIRKLARSEVLPNPPAGKTHAGSTQLQFAGKNR